MYNILRNQLCIGKQQQLPYLEVWIVDGGLDVAVDPEHMDVQDLLAAELFVAQLALMNLLQNQAFLPKFLVIS